MGEKRRYSRMVVRGMSFDVSDGMRCCSGTVQDVSLTGLCLADMTRRFGKNIDVYAVVATSGRRCFKFRVRPKWEEVSGVSKRMGVEIKEPSRAWLEYVQSLESQSVS